MSRFAEVLHFVIERVGRLERLAKTTVMVSVSIILTDKIDMKDDHFLRVMSHHDEWQCSQIDTHKQINTTWHFALCTKEVRTCSRMTLCQHSTTNITGRVAEVSRHRDMSRQILSSKSIVSTVSSMSSLLYYPLALSVFANSFRVSCPPPPRLVCLLASRSFFLQSFAFLCSPSNSYSLWSRVLSAQYFFQLTSPESHNDSVVLFNC